MLAATPIGSHRDASPALVEALATADIVAAEDTRLFAKLARRVGADVSGRVVSYFEGNEEARTAELVAAIADGQRVVLATDAGMPMVSDPGYRLVTACVDRGLRVTAIPGPSAVLTALAVSGLATDRFCFEGFLPRKQAARKQRLKELVTERRTMIFFEAPHRVSEFLADASEVLGGDRRAAVCRELTKPHEEVVRGELSHLLDWALAGVRGEVTIVVAGSAAAEVSPQEALSLVMDRVRGGVKLSNAARDVSKATGVDRKLLYEAAVTTRAEERNAK